MSTKRVIVCTKCNCTDFSYDSLYKEYSCEKCGSIIRLLLCEKCNCGDFVYDSLHKEYSCANCGWIANDKGNILVIQRENTKLTLPEKANETAMEQPPSLVKSVSRRKELVVLPFEYHYARDPSLITFLLKIMLFICLLSIIVSIIFTIRNYKVLELNHFEREMLTSSCYQDRSIPFSPYNSYIRPRVEAHLFTFSIFKYVFLGVLFITWLCFLRWIYLANVNCNSFSNQQMKYTPGRAVAMHALFPVTFFQSYIAMKEIWNISENPRMSPSLGRVPVYGGRWETHVWR